MSGVSRSPSGPPRQPSLLSVTTIASTLKFITPFALHYRAQGWRVEAAASGAVAASAYLTAFDACHELPLSRSILDIRGMLRSLRTMRALLERDYDIVHVHTPIASFITRLAVRLQPRERRPAVVYTAHGFHFHSAGNPLVNLVFVCAEKIAGLWTDRLVVINDEDRSAARRFRIVPRERLIHIPGIGIDTDHYSRASVDAADVAAARASLSLGPEVPLFVVVAELNRNKRPLDVIEALGKSGADDAHLVFLGDGPERPRMEAAIDSLGLANRVRVQGFIPDVRAYLVASTALILASRREGLPRSIMEALSLEVPVIATDARGSRELVSPGVGLVVPVGDTNRLAAAITQLARDPGMARELGRAGRARMIESYDQRHVTRLHDELYADLLQRRAGA